MSSFWDRLRKRQPNVNISSAAEDTSSRSSHDEEAESEGLDRRLRSPQIFMIALSGIIGVTIFATMGQFIHTAGPAGLLTAIFFVGTTAICVMEGLGELTVQWPVSNAMVQFVKTFVDEELAIAIGIVYWYTWSSVISAMVVAAANLSQYWGFSATGCVVVFYVICPLSMIFINWIGVFWYGIVECVGGFLKFVFVVVGGFFLIGEGTTRYGSQYINQGYHNDARVAKGRFAAVLAANTALYVASRVLYGLVNDSQSPSWLQWLAKLNRHRVPMWALVVSAASWFWLPFLQLKKAYSVDSFFAVIITIGSVGTVIVWASQCLAFIRYFHWLRAHKLDIQTFRRQDPVRWRKYDRWQRNNRDRYYSIMSELQPVPAYVGLIFCGLIVLAFSSAPLWTGNVSAKKIFVAYGGLILCIGIWLTAKVINRNPAMYRTLGYNVENFRTIIDDFETRLYLRDEDDQLHRRGTMTVTTTEIENAIHLPSISTAANERPSTQSRGPEAFVQAGAHLENGVSGNFATNPMVLNDELSLDRRWGQ